MWGELVWFGSWWWCGVVFWMESSHVVCLVHGLSSLCLLEADSLLTGSHAGGFAFTGEPFLEGCFLLMTEDQLRFSLASFSLFRLVCQ